MKNRLGMLTLLMVSATPGSESFREDFSKGLSPDRWKISTWTAPKNSPINRARFSADHVEIKDGILRLKLTQHRNDDGSITSIGSEIQSKRTFGYGTFSYSMKASSTSSLPYETGNAVSGSITGSFIYKDKSETEIDIEVEGLEERNSLTLTTTWKDEHTPETKVISSSIAKGLPHHGFHDYKIIWTPTFISFFRNGQLISKHTQIVPTSPGVFIFNHWGTNEVKWGGFATPGVDRYMFVKNFEFIPM